MEKKLQIKIAKQNYYPEKREKERDFTIMVVVTGLLQFYNRNRKTDPCLVD